MKNGKTKEVKCGKYHLITITQINKIYAKE